MVGPYTMQFCIFYIKRWGKNGSELSVFYKKDAFFVKRSCIKVFKAISWHNL